MRKRKIWKETSFDNMGIVYLTGHDPRELCAVVRGEKEEIPSNFHNYYGDRDWYQPIVYCAPYRKGHVAIREFRAPDKSINYRPSHLFDILQNAALAKAGFVEIPLAFITTKTGYSTLVTKWKYDRKQKSLHEFLRDRHITFNEKERTVRHAAEILARFHAAGFAHGHPHAKNFLVVGGSKVTCIDPTKISRINEKDEEFLRTRDFNYFKSSINGNLYEFGVAVQKRFETAANEAYGSMLIHCKRKT